MIKQNMMEIIRSIEGVIPMSDRLENLFQSINEGRIPEVWHRVSTSSIFPTSIYTFVYSEASISTIIEYLV